MSEFQPEANWPQRIFKFKNSVMHNMNWQHFKAITDQNPFKFLLQWKQEHRKKKSSAIKLSKNTSSRHDHS